MIIAGKEIKTRLDKIPVDKLEPDFNNPRRHELALDLESKGLDPDMARTPEGIRQSGKFTELCRAIVENKGISMPLVVQEIKDEKFKVVDGDRRLGAVNYILEDEEILEKNPDLKEQLSELPCIVVEQTLTNEDLLRLLTHIHMQFVDWKPISKDLIMEQLESILGSEAAGAVMGMPEGRARKAAQIREYAKRFTVKGPAAISYAREISSLKKSFRTPEIVNATVAKVASGKMTYCGDIKALRKIIPVPEAKAVYLKPESTVEDALKVVRSEELKKSLERPEIGFKDIIENLTLSLKGVPFSELSAYKGNEDLKNMVDSCIDLLGTFRGYI